MRRSVITRSGAKSRIVCPRTHRFGRIRDHEIEIPRLEREQRFDAIARESDLEAHLLEQQLEILRRGSLVLRHQNRIRHQLSPREPVDRPRE